MGKIIPKILFLIIIVCFSFSFAALSSAAQKDKKQAQNYRDQGYDAQRAGNLDMALSYYQRAIAADPSFALVHNDMGIVLEAQGKIAEAKQAYLRALALDPKLLSAYYNIAALYEKAQEYEKAAYYWKMRVQLGEWSDVWTWRAKQHLDTLQETHKVEGSGIPAEGPGVLSPTADAKRDAQYHLYRGRQYIAAGDYTLALRELSKAYMLDENNHEIGTLLDETERRVLLYK